MKEKSKGIKTQWRLQYSQTRQAQILLAKSALVFDQTVSALNHKTGMAKRMGKLATTLEREFGSTERLLIRLGLIAGLFCLGGVFVVFLISLSMSALYYFGTK